jgi:GxxExxY protein
MKGREFSDLSNKVIGCVIEVHKTLDPGLLESSYQQCLAHELGINQIEFKIECPLPVKYKGIRLDCGYRLDLLVEDKIILELKSVEQLKGIHEAQLLTANIKQGFLINFNAKLLKQGLKSFVL